LIRRQLRLKVKIGDGDPQVLSECFMGLLKLAPTQSLPLVAEFLDRPEAKVCAMETGRSLLAISLTPPSKALGSRAIALQPVGIENKFFFA
jgi:hypothetical protein